MERKGYQRVGEKRERGKKWKKMITEKRRRGGGERNKEEKTKQQQKDTTLNSQNEKLGGTKKESRREEEYGKTKEEAENSGKKQHKEKERDLSRALKVRVWRLLAREEGREGKERKGRRNLGGKGVLTPHRHQKETQKGYCFTETPAMGGGGRSGEGSWREGQGALLVVEGHRPIKIIIITTVCNK